MTLMEFAIARTYAQLTQKRPLTPKELKLRWLLRDRVAIYERRELCSSGESNRQTSPGR